MNRLPIVGVMGSGQEAHSDLAEPLGLLIANLGCHLLTGGGAGVMAAVSRAFCSAADRRGRSIGILPEGCQPNPGVEIPIHTQLSAEHDRAGEGWPWSRNHINVRTSTVVIALPGGPGTASELELAASGPHARPCLAFLGRHGRIDQLALSDSRTTLRTANEVHVPVALEIGQVRTFLAGYINGPKDDARGS